MPSRSMFRGIAAVCLVWGLWVAFQAARTYLASACAEAPSYDQLGHLLDGLKLYNNLVTFSPFSFLLNLGGLSYWPPVPPLLEVPFYLLGGPSNVAGVALSWFCFLLSISLGVAFICRHLFANSFFGAAAASLVFTGFLTGAPLLLTYSVYAMYELPGAAFTLLATVCYWRAWDEREKGSQSVLWYRRTALATLVLILTKPNFGLPFLLSMAAAEWLLGEASLRREVWRFLGKLLDPRILPGLTIPGLAFAGLAAIIQFSGGGTFSVLGQAVSMTRPDNPIYAAWLLLAAKSWLVVKRQPLRVSPECSALVRWLVVPYAAWLTYPLPNRFSAIVYHFTHGGAFAGGSRFAAENLLFYPRAFTSAYSDGSWLLALLGAGLGAALFFSGKGKSVGPRFALGFSIFAFSAATVLTGVKDMRLVLPYLPPLFLVAAWGLGRMATGPALGASLAIVLCVALSHRPAVADLMKGPGTLATLCFDSSEGPAQIRKTILGGPNETEWRSFGIEPGSPVGYLLELEIQRAFPRLSNWPAPSAIDLGYRVTAASYLEGALPSGKLRVALVARPSDRAYVSDAILAQERIRASGRIETALPFHWPALKYEGILFVLRR